MTPSRRPDRSGDQPSLAVNLAGLTLKNPVMTASGTCGYGEEYLPFCAVEELGALVVKGLSLQPRPGNPSPRIWETCGGMLNAIGLQNMGVAAFLRDKLPLLRTFKTPVIVNIFGETQEEYVRLAKILSDADGIAGLEVNISCPNVKKGGVAFGADPAAAAAVTRGVRAATILPVIVKLTPNVTDIAAIARAVEEAGADAVSLINTLTGMAVDVERRVPRLQNITGGLSGPAIKPVAVRMVWQVAQAVSIPVIGIGGIADSRDALEFLIVGATAVQVGTASFINPRAALEIRDGLRAYLRRHGMTHIGQVIGSLCAPR